VSDIVTTGLVASGNGCEGVVRLAMEVTDVFALLREPGLEETILLAESATATALVPLLPKVRGLICTSGGITSHLAILSREFGLSCLMAAAVEDPAALEGVRVVINADGTVVRA
jgi:phosphoenolpyruvate-protein kinase (PTS system EI component)